MVDEGSDGAAVTTVERTQGDLRIGEARHTSILPSGVAGRWAAVHATRAGDGGSVSVVGGVNAIAHPTVDAGRLDGGVVHRERGRGVDDPEDPALRPSDDGHPADGAGVGGHDHACAELLDLGDHGVGVPAWNQVSQWDISAPGVLASSATPPMADSGAAAVEGETE